MSSAETASTASPAALADIPPVTRRLDAIESVFQVTLATLRRALRGKRLMLVALLLGLPCLLAWSIARGEEPRIQENFLYSMLTFYQFGIAVPGLALLMATTFPWPESDEGTLTYWFTLPVRRWTVHLGRILASTLIGIVLLPIGVVLLAAPLDAGEAVKLGGPIRTAATATMLAFPAYLGFFTLMSTWTRRGLIWGVVLILIENSLSLVTGNLARMTIVFYVRSLLWPATSTVGRRILEKAARMDAPAAPSTAIGVFLGVALVATVMALVVVEVTEYRGKHGQPG